MMPHERSLVEKLKDKPFALVGVNGDQEYDKKFSENIEKHKVNWRSFKNDQGSNPEISTCWNLGGWPTLYLIDHKGVIQKVYVGSPEDQAELDELIDKLIKKAEEK